MKISTTSERLKEIMERKGLKQVDVVALAKPYCEKYGVKLGKTDLSQYVNGQVEPKQEKLTVLGLALNVSEPWLMGYNVAPERKTTNTPAPSEDSAGAISVEALELMLVQAGFIRPGEDLTDDDLDFLLSVGRIVETWFRKRQKNGSE